MSVQVTESWSNFKSIISDRLIKPQFYRTTEQKLVSGVIQEYLCVHIYGKDDYIIFRCDLDEGTSDYTDFENNYESTWNQTIQLRDSAGLSRIHSSPRPDSMTTYFSSAGDNVGVGDGNELLFDMKYDDPSSSKSVDLTFNEDVYIKDGFMMTSDAPFGSSIDVEVVDPVAGTVASFCKNVKVMGSFPVPLNTEDSAKIQQGLILRVTVNHADTKADFKVIGRMEMYRVNTV